MDTFNNICSRCGRTFKEGDYVVPVHHWQEDFEQPDTGGPSRLPSEFIHERCFGRPNELPEMFG